MVSLMFIRVVWGIWWAFSMYLLGASLSGFAFERLERKKRGQWSRLFLNLGVALVWPAMLLTQKSRAKLVKTLKGIL